MEFENGKVCWSIIDGYDRIREPFKGSCFYNIDYGDEQFFKIEGSGDLLKFERFFTYSSRYEAWQIYLMCLRVKYNQEKSKLEDLKINLDSAYRKFEGLKDEI